MNGTIAKALSALITIFIWFFVDWAIKVFLGIYQPNQVLTLKYIIMLLLVKLIGNYVESKKPENIRKKSHETWEMALIPPIGLFLIFSDMLSKREQT